MIRSSVRRRGQAGASRQVGWTALGLALLLASTGSTLVGQQPGRVEGTVTAAATARAVDGASVVVEGQNLAVRTDAGGAYRIAALAPGVYVLVVRRLGYEPGRTTVTIAGGATTRADVVLVESPVLLTDLTVTATREAERTAEIPANIGVVNDQDVRLSKPHHPAEIVGHVPGVLVVDLGGEGHTVAMRQAINYNAVYAYLEDGVPIRSTGFFNHNAMYEINVPGADRIEVFKGPATALYGSDAIGGAINVLTRPPSATPSVELLAEGGRFGYARSLASASNTWGPHGLRADLNVTHFDGRRDQANQNRQSGTLRWDYAPSARAHLKTVFTASNIDSPGDGGSDISRSEFDQRATINYTPIAFRKVRAVRLSTAFEAYTDRSLFSATVYGRYNRLNLLPFWQLTYDPQVWDTHNKSLGLLARYRRNFRPLQSSAIVGVDVDYSPGERVEDELLPTATPNSVFDGYTVGVRQYDYDVTFRGVSPYVQLEGTPVRGLHFTAGLRLDQVGYDYTNRLTPLDTGAHRRPPSTTVSYTHLSPKVGATYEFSDAVNLFASYRHGFRVPSEDQLFVQNSAANTVGLEPVRAQSYEAGVRAHAARRVSLDASVYTMDVTDDILSFFNTTDFTSETSNAGRTRHWGVEVGAGVAFTDAVRLEASYTYARHRYLQWVTATGSDFSGNDVESGPKHIANTRATYQPSFLRNSAITAEWVHVGRYFTDPENLHTYGGYDLLNVYFNATIMRGFGLVGRLNNVTDANYAVTASFNPFVPVDLQERFTPGLPRTLFLGLQYNWTR
jgi:outer membrane receptor protein involved in Fe transport